MTLLLPVLPRRGVGAIGQLGRLDEHGRTGVPVAHRLRCRGTRRCGVGRGAVGLGTVGRIWGNGTTGLTLTGDEGGGVRRAPGGGSRPGTTGRPGAVGPGLLRIAVALPARAGPGGHAGGIEYLVDDVGLLRPARRLERHGLGDGIELISLLAFEY